MVWQDGEMEAGVRRGGVYEYSGAEVMRDYEPLPTAKGFLSNLHSKWQPLATWGQACGTPGQAGGMVTNTMATCLLSGA